MVATVPPFATLTLTRYASCGAPVTVTRLVPVANAVTALAAPGVIVAAFMNSTVAPAAMSIAARSTPGPYPTAVASVFGFLVATTCAAVPPEHADTTTTTDCCGTLTTPAPPSRIASSTLPERGIGQHPVPVPPDELINVSVVTGTVPEGAYMVEAL